jgi:mRNA interferase RelE/StbE
MARYSIRFLTPARRALRRLPPSAHDRVSVAIDQLRDDPRPHGVKQLVNQRERVYRIRVSDYRILYEVHDDEVLVIVVDVAKRDDAYRFREHEEPYHLETAASA